MSAAFTANDRARDMILDIGGPRTWGDTKESWRYRVARLIHSTPRRVKAILNNEPIRLSADEYIDIQTRWERAHAAVASLSSLAGQADALADTRVAPRGAGPVRDGDRADEEARGRSTSPPAARRLT